MYLHYTSTGYLLISPEDNCHRIVDAMLAIGYTEEFCIALDFSPEFVARLMEAGFLVMSSEIDREEDGDQDSENGPEYILLPKLHLVRSALFFENLHIKKSIRRFLNRYELRPDTDFELILDRCVQVHGADWLTPPLVSSIKKIRKNARTIQPVLSAGDRRAAAVYPTSFALYREGKLVAGEFGVIAGRVYTSYSGYYDEDNAGTVQMILTTRYLEQQDFSFFDLGMPLEYKSDLGATDISPEEFVPLFRNSCSRATP
jgi:Leu/Phe-tRNA-protein transferase